MAAVGEGWTQTAVFYGTVRKLMDWVDPSSGSLPEVPINTDTKRTMANYYEATAMQLHQSFIKNLKELNETSCRFWRKEIIEELLGIQSDAQTILDMNVLHELHAARLKHIIGRDIKQFIYFARHKDKTHDPSDDSALLKRYRLPERDPI